MPLKTIFLDRDGVINKDVNYLYKINEVEFFQGLFETCKYFLELGYQIIIVTNQSGIARGYFTDKDFNKLTKWMLLEFKKNNIHILDVLHCPHGPYSDCKCRKPKPGMFLTAKNKYLIDMDKSWMIGDKESDIKAANDAGIKNTIIVKNGNNIDYTKSLSKFFIETIDQSKKIIVD